MARTLTAAVKTEAKKSSGAKIIAFVKLEFDGGDLRYWNGRGDITFNAEVYTGLGNLGKISQVEEGIDQRPFGIVLEISGVTPADVAIALAEEIQGRKCQVWLGFLDDNYVLIADPMLLFRGRLDTMDIEIGKEAVIKVTAESRLIDWDRPRIHRYTDADQQERFPGDLGLEFVSDTTDREINWGGQVSGQGGGSVTGASNPSPRIAPPSEGRGQTR